MPNPSRFHKRQQELYDLAKKNGENSALYNLADHINLLKESKTALNQEETKKLIGLYAQAGLELKAAYDKSKNNPEKSEYYRRIMKKYSKDYTNLHKYMRNLNRQENPKLMNIDEFFEASKTRSVKLSDTEMTELDKTGAGQNIRYKINLKLQDEPVDGVSKGDIFTGYFTEDIAKDSTEKYKEVPLAPDNCIISKDAHDSILSYIQKKYPGAKKFINNRLKNKADVYAFEGTGLDDELRLRVTEVMTTRTKDEIKEHFINFANNSTLTTPDTIKTINSINTEEELFAYLEYSSLYMKSRLAEGVMRNNEINPKAALGQRNALTSAVAEVLGCGNIVAFSEKLKVEALENGKKVTKKGVLMMPAQGYDIADVSSKSPMLKMSQLDIENPSLTKSLATLQFLDYVLANTDRHRGNLFYQFDKDGRLVLVQGIDNDTCCGSGEHLDQINSAVNFKDLKIIPKSMADNISALKPEVFEVLLQGYGLNEAEINTTIERFKEIQGYIKKSEKLYEGTEPGYLASGTPRIVPDEDMDKYSINEDLAYINIKKMHQSNLFGKVKDYAENPTSGFKNAVKSETKKCCDLAADLTIARLDKGPGSLYKFVKDMTDISGKVKITNKERKTALNKLLKDAKKIFSSKYSTPDLILTDYDTDTEKYKIIIGRDFEDYKKVIETALDSANEFLATSPESVIDYQTLKAEVDMYKASGKTEKMQQAQEELEKMEQNPEVQQYKLAVKVRDKYTNMLHSMNKINETVQDMNEIFENYKDIRTEVVQKNSTYEKSEARARHEEESRRIYRNNKLNNLNAPKPANGKQPAPAPHL